MSSIFTPSLTERRLLPGPTVQKILGHKHQESFYRFVRQEGIPYIQLNSRRIVFDEAALNAWLERRTVGGGK